MSEKKRDLDALLDEWAVHVPGMWENELSDHPLLKDWYAVSNTNGIVAYFGKEEDACRFRLAEINRELNG